MQNAFFRRRINDGLGRNEFLGDSSGVSAFIQKRNFFRHALHTGFYRPVAQAPLLVL